VVELVVRVVEQDVLLGDGVEGVDEPSKSRQSSAGNRVFQIIPAHIGEADEI
jgi:hypothetical protein